MTLVLRIWLIFNAISVLLAWAASPTISKANLQQPGAQMKVVSSSNFGDYYFYLGKKVPLWRSNTHLVVRNVDQNWSKEDWINDKEFSNTKVFTVGVELRFLTLPRDFNDVERESYYQNLRNHILNHSNQAVIEPVYVTPHNSSWVICRNKIIVKLKQNEKIEHISNMFRAKVLEKLKLRNTYILEVSGNPLQISNEINLLPQVEWSEPDFISETKPDFIPNDPLFEDQWHLSNTGQFGGTRGADLNLIPAWDFPRISKDVVVTIFDDGIDRDHPDLDYLPGRNYINSPPTNDPWPEGSENSHGTSCAGLTGAIHNNNLGVSGIAPGIKILPIKVTNWPYGNSASSRRVGDAVYYAAENSDIGSVSVGVFGSNYVSDIISEVAETGRDGKGWMFFKSSGNDGEARLHSPGYVEEVIAVGSSSDDDRKSSFSNWGSLPGKTVDFVTPGSNVWTTKLEGRYGGFGGTSASTPIAAGIAALILTVNPELTRDEVLDIMRASCDKIGGVQYNEDGIHAQYGYGRPNAEEALKLTPKLNSSIARNFSKGEFIREIQLDKERFIISFAEIPSYQIKMDLFNSISGEFIKTIRSNDIGKIISLPHGLQSNGFYTYKLKMGNQLKVGRVLNLD